MSKRAKTEPTGKDFVNAAIEIAPGLVIDTKLKLGAIWYLEDKYNKSINDILSSMTDDKDRIRRVSDIANIIVALAMQNNPDLLENEVVRKVRQLDQDHLANAVQKLNGILDVHAKNLTGAGPIQEATN